MFAFCSIDGSASIANRHRTIHDEGPQRTVSPCPLSASIITCLKCANDPTPMPCVCLYPISEEIETHREDHTQTLTNPKLYLVRLSRESRFTNDASFWRGVFTENDKRLLIPLRAFQLKIRGLSCVLVLLRDRSSTSSFARKNDGREAREKEKTDKPRERLTQGQRKGMSSPMIIRL